MKNEKMIRGGRLTKYKGGLGSCAPKVGIFAMAIAMLFTPCSDLYANNEAGVEGVGADTITVPAGSYPSGITYEDSDGLTLILDADSLIINDTGVHVTSSATGTGDISVIGTDVGAISTAGVYAIGLHSYITDTASMATATALLNAGDIVTTGEQSHGVYARSSGLGSTLAQMDGGTITTGGVYAHGLLSFTAITGTATSLLTAGDIVTTGGYSTGVDAETTGLGDALTQMDGGTITTGGVYAHGLSSEIRRNATSTGTATSLLTAGDIVTAGDNAIGLYATTNGLGDALTQMDGGTITINGSYSYGLYSHISNTASMATATSLLNAGDIVTTGDHTTGLNSQSDGLGSTLAQMDGGTMTTEGEDANGLLSFIDNSASTGTATSLLTAGDIVTAGDNAIGLYATTNGLGDALTQMDGGTITTSGERAYGLLSYITNTASTATATSLLTAGDIETTGVESRGLYARHDGLGDTLVQMDGGSITTSGEEPYGLRSYISNAASTATATALLTAGDILTAGDNADGIHVHHAGLGDVVVTTTGGTLTTSGADAHGIATLQTNAAATGATTITIGSDITAGGDGINVSSVSSGDVLITGNGDITGGTDVGDDGIEVNAVANVTIDVNGAISGDPGILINSTLGAINIAGTGNVTGTADGIQANITDAAATTDITIARDGVITGGDNGILTNNAGSGNNIITTTQAVNGGTGAAISSNTLLGSNTIFSIGADVTAGASGIAIANNEGDSTATITAGLVSGEIRLGDGSDDVTFAAGSDASGITVFDGGDDVASADGFVDTLTLTNQNLSIAGANVINWENIILDGGTSTFSDGALTVGSESGNGLTITGAGVLNGGGAFALTGNMQINDLSTFQGFGGGSGAYSVSGNLINSGIITTQDGAVGDVVNVGGNYTGGGQLLIDADFATDTADELNIGGNVTGGGTQVSVQDVSSGPATGNDVRVISVAGTTSDGDFTLNAPVVNGAFNYNSLALVGQDWFLQSVGSGGGGKSYTPIASGYEGLSLNLLTLETLETLDQRDSYYTAKNTATSKNPDDLPIWFRAVGGQSNIDSAESTTGSDYKTNHWKAQLGAETLIADDSSGRYLAGINVSYNNADTDVSSSAGSSSVDTRGYSLGLTSTWYSKDGYYVDLQAQKSWYESEISANGVGGGTVESIDGDGYSLSIEGGKHIGFETKSNKTFSITPQAQLVYSEVDYEDFTGSNNEVVRLEEAKSLKVRLGATLETEFYHDNESETHCYLLSNVIHEFYPENSVNVSGAFLINQVDNLRGEFGAGLSHVWKGDNATFEAFAEVTGSTSLDDFGSSNGLKGSLGFKMRF